MAKSAAAQEGQPGQGFGSTGSKAANRPGPCPPPAQPLGLGSVTKATMTLSSAGASTPGGSQVRMSRHRKFRRPGAPPPNHLRQPAVGGDHGALSTIRRNAKVITTSNTWLSEDRPLEALSFSGSQAEPQARGYSAPGSSAWSPIALKHFKIASANNKVSAATDTEARRTQHAVEKTVPQYEEVHMQTSCTPRASIGTGGACTLCNECHQEHSTFNLCMSTFY